MSYCSQSIIQPTALAPIPQYPRQHQQIQEFTDEQHLSSTVKMPATYTAFTSRIGLSDASTPVALESEMGTSTKSITIQGTPRTFGSPQSYCSSSDIYCHESGVDADDDFSSESDDCAVADEDESDWEDEEESRCRAGYYDADGCLIFSRISKPPTRSLASNLSMLLRQAGSKPSGTTPEPFTTGRMPLPNPLRCHPGLAAVTAASLTPGNIMSPPMLPPAPPSSPCGSDRRMTTATTPSISGASYTSASATPSSSVGSSTTTCSESSSSLSRDNSRAPSAAPSVLPSRSASPVMRINQLSALHAPLYHHGSMQSIIDNNGDPLLTMPFNGGLGPRAAPIIHLGPPTPNGPGRREIFSGSGLLESEMTGSLRESIMDENNSRYIFKHYGSRRYAEEDIDEDTTVGSSPSIYTPNASTAGIPACDIPGFRRTQSAPNIPRTSRTPMTKSKSSLYLADKMPLRRIYYVDDYEAPKSWNWGMDYHSHGW